MPVWRSIYRLKQFTEHLRYVIQNAFTGLLTWCANYNVHKGEIIVVLLDSTTSGYITGPKGGFPFSGKSRAIDFLRLLSFEIQAIKRNGWGWLHAFEKKVIAKSRSRDFFHWMEIRLYAGIFNQGNSNTSILKNKYTPFRITYFDL